MLWLLRKPFTVLLPSLKHQAQVTLKSLLAQVQLAAYARDGHYGVSHRFQYLEFGFFPQRHGFRPSLFASKKEMEKGMQLSDPPDIDTCCSDGFDLNRTGDFSGAERNFREAIKLEPTEVRAHIGLGAALHAQGDLNGAKRSLRRAVELDPTNAAAHLALGTVYKSKADALGNLCGNPKVIARLLLEAAEHFEFAHGVDEENVVSIRARAASLSILS